MPIPRLPFAIAAVVVAAALASDGSRAHGHELDEYLQTALVLIQPQSVRLSLNLAPGSEIAEAVLAPVDRDGDGEISGDEQTAYAETLPREITLQLDGRPLELAVESVSFPETRDLQSGWGIIQVGLAADVAPLDVGEHRLRLENRHQRAISTYQVNAARPRTESVKIVRQERNDDQSIGEIVFALNATPPPTAMPPAARPRTATTVMLLPVCGAIALAVAILWLVFSRPRTS